MAINEETVKSIEGKLNKLKLCGLNSTIEIDEGKIVMRIHEVNRGFKRLKVPDGIQVIKTMYLKQCVFFDLEELSLPGSLEVIDRNAFEHTRNLRHINFTEPSNLKVIGARAFIESRSLEEIEFPSSLEIIEEYSFNLSGIKHLALKENKKIVKIGDCAFANSKIEKLELPDELEYIGYKAFYGCIGIKDFEVPRDLPKKLKVIDMEAFKFCHSIKGKIDRQYTEKNGLLVNYGVFDDTNVIVEG